MVKKYIIQREMAKKTSIEDGGFSAVAADPSPFFTVPHFSIKKRKLYIGKFLFDVLTLF